MLESEQGLHPVYHQKKSAAQATCLLLYWLIYGYQLKQQGINLSWDKIRNIMSTQQRITITLPTDDNKTINLRTTTRAEMKQKQIYDALNLKPDLIGKYKTIIDNKKFVVPTETK